MSELSIRKADVGGWEKQRQTGRFAVKPYSHEETQTWLAAVGMPPMLDGETDKQYADKIATEKETIAPEEQGE